MLSDRLKKIDSDISKTKAKVSEYTTKLRELEKLRLETENTEIVALVRAVNISPDELMAFVNAYKDKEENTKYDAIKNDEDENV